MKNIARPASSKLLREPPDTRQLLIESALYVLAEQGVEAASMSRIIREAGARNPSAILYHFGSREGLLRAVLQHVADLLKPLQTEMMSDLKSVEQKRALTPRDIVAAVHLPVLHLYFSGQQGKNAVRVLSRCTWEFGEDGQQMLVEVLGPSLDGLYDELVVMLPDARRDELALRFLLSLSSLFHAVTDMRVTDFLPVVGRTEAHSLIDQPGRLTEVYLDFQCNGLLGGLQAAD